MVCGLGLLVSSFLVFPECVKIMRGDYMFGRWVETIQTNKNFLLLIVLGISGGCISYIGYKLYKRRQID